MMGKRLLLLGVHGEAAHAMAAEYTHKLGMHQVVEHRREGPDGTSDGVIMAGAEILPYLAVISGKGPASAASRILDLYAPGVSRLVYLTDDYERDVTWLRGRGPVGEHRISYGDARVVRHAMGLIGELGVVVDVIDEPGAIDRGLLAAVLDALMRADIVAPALAGAPARPRPAAPPEAAASATVGSAGSALAAAQLDHVAIYVSDMAAADRVVREFLGQEHVSDLTIPLKVSPLQARTFRDPSPEPRTRFVITLCHSARGRVPDWIATRGSPGVHHLAHRVDDLDRALQSARDSGATQLSAVAEVEWLRQVMLRVTSDGYLHELIWRTDDRALDEANALRLIESQ